MQKKILHNYECPATSQVYPGEYLLMDTIPLPAEAEYLTFNFIEELVVEFLGVVAFNRNSETVGIHVVDHHVIVFPQNADDLSPLIFLAINSVIFHMLSIDVVSLALAG